MALQLRYDPDPILHQVCTPIPEVTPEIQELARQMCETMVLEHGAGLAAPQVGHAIRMFVTYNPADESKPLVWINPTFVLKSSKLVAGGEGCLSFPGRPREVERHKEVSVRALDLNGKPFVVKAEGFFARCLQHEYDHLDGITLY